MSRLRELAADSRYETIRIKAVLIPFPVSIELSDGVKETLPRTVVKATEGVRIMRFYTSPVPGDAIEFNGFLFKVIGRRHEVRVKGSPHSDKMPIVLTEYIGAIEGDSHGE